MKKTKLCLTLSLALTASLAGTGDFPEQEVLIAQANAADTTSSENILANPRVELEYYDTVYFGNYWQEDVNGDQYANTDDDKQPILWRVLSTDGNDAYVISDKILMEREYSKKTDSFSGSSLRQWLNGDVKGDFLYEAFTEEERNVIIGTEGSKIQLPDMKDVTSAEYGFSEYDDTLDQARIADVTPYAASKGQVTVDGFDAPYYHRPHSWWVADGRCIGVNGALFETDKENWLIGIRPVLHIDLSSDLVKQGDPVIKCLKKTVWNYVELGTYNGSPIKWRVLNVNEDDAFLLSDRILAQMPYDETIGTPWKNCNVRKWLNKDFYLSAFSEQEQAGILQTLYQNENIRWEYLSKDSGSTENISLLSYEDIKKTEYGFPSALGCEHLVRTACDATGHKTNGYGIGWWLRSPRTSDNIEIVTEKGNCNYDLAPTVEKDYEGNVIAKYYPELGVRPAMHVSIQTLGLKKKGTITAEENKIAEVIEETPITEDTEYTAEPGTASVHPAQTNAPSPAAEDISGTSSSAPAGTPGISPLAPINTPEIFPPAPAGMPETSPLAPINTPGIFPSDPVSTPGISPLAPINTPDVFSSFPINTPDISSSVPINTQDISSLAPINTPDVSSLAPASTPDALSSAAPVQTTSPVTNDTKSKSKPTVNLKNKKSYKPTVKVTIYAANQIKQVKINSKILKIKSGKKKIQFKLSKYKKYLKKKGKWNLMVITDKKGNKTSVKFKTK